MRKPGPFETVEVLAKKSSRPVGQHAIPMTATDLIDRHESAA
jgi:hypothetical protein